MITDEKGMEWMFQKLYDAGWRYIVADNYDNIYLTNEKPVMFDDVDEVRISSCEKRIGATGFIKILPKLKPNEVFSIEEELGIVDWSKVKVDTPILVRDFENMKWAKRHFAFFKNGKVYTWDGGVTSWTCVNPNCVMSWKYAKLAEV
uniref:Uncharacterized protein n=1 Tax=Podoviridae sp. ctf5T2 TaxID=2827743 RepID=A0A8S5SMH6_9CAUD|nr:MAG TPA: hypothetical protein [Podoviridae sp. ctf5T2]